MFTACYFSQTNLKLKNMKKIIFYAMILMLFSSAVSQKKTSTPISLKYFIEPTHPLPASLKKYNSQIITPANPFSYQEEREIRNISPLPKEQDKAVAEAKKQKFDGFAKQYLSINNSSLIPVKKEEDFMITLNMSSIDVSYVTDQKFTEMEDSDIVFRYAYTAKLSVTAANGELLFEKWVHEAEENQKVTKKQLWDNPGVKAKLALFQNNSEKKNEIVQAFIDDNDLSILTRVLQNANIILDEAFVQKYIDAPLALHGVKGKAFKEIEEANETLHENYLKMFALSKKKRLPKSVVDEDFKNALPVWQTYIADKATEMEEDALKGLYLNCAVAYLWLGEPAKAKEYLDKVPEAEKSIGKPETVNISSGRIMTYNLRGYAVNTRDTYENLVLGPSRITIPEQGLN